MPFGKFGCSWPQITLNCSLFDFTLLMALDRTPNARNQRTAGTMGLMSITGHCRSITSYSTRTICAEALSSYISPCVNAKYKCPLPFLFLKIPVGPVLADIPSWTLCGAGAKKIAGIAPADEPAQ